MKRPVNTLKHDSLYMMEFLKEKEKWKRQKEYLKKQISWKLSKSIKTLIIYKFQPTPTRTNSNRLSPQYTVAKMSKDKDEKEILKIARGKRFILYKGASIRLMADFWSEAIEARESGMI